MYGTQNEIDTFVSISLFESKSRRNELENTLKSETQTSRLAAPVFEQRKCDASHFDSC
jgi:hypothetical protein